MALDGVEVVFLDVGGTLAWAEPSADVIWAKALEEHGIHLSPQEVIRHTGVPGPEVNRSELIRAIQAAEESFRGIPFPGTLEEQEGYFRPFDAAVLRRMGVPVEEAILDSVARRFREDVVTRVYEDTLPALEHLRDAGLRLGVISNATHDLPRRLQEAGLAPYFETLTYSYEVGVEKPAPEIFEAALTRMAVASQQAVHVGNNYAADVVGARGVGMLPILLVRQGTPSPVNCLTVSTLTAILDAG